MKALTIKEIKRYVVLGESPKLVLLFRGFVRVGYFYDGELYLYNAYSTEFQTYPRILETLLTERHPHRYELYLFNPFYHNEDGSLKTTQERFIMAATGQYGAVLSDSVAAIKVATP